MVNRLHVFQQPPPSVVRSLSGSSSATTRRSHEAHTQVRTDQQLNLRNATFEIVDGKATVLVDWGFEEQCVDPTVEMPVRRSAQEVIDARFSRPEYSNWHNYHRQDREGTKFSSFEVWNQHGSQPAGRSRTRPG